MAKTNVQKYMDLYERLRKGCRAWVLIDNATGKKVGDIIMRFTPNAYGQFGRGGMTIERYDNPDYPNIATDRLVATATAGGCGYDKVRQMIEAMLSQLKDPITKYWGNVFVGDIYNFYEEVFKNMGLTLYVVI